MPIDSDVVENTQPETIEISGYFLGVNNADPTLVEGQGGLKSCTWVSEGLYRFKFRERYEALTFCAFTLMATTPGDLKGYTVVAKSLDTSATDYYTLDVSVYDSTNTIADIIAAQWLHFEFKFRRTVIKQ